jgi:hypothetical protein
VRESICKVCVCGWVCSSIHMIVDFNACVSEWICSRMYVHGLPATPAIHYSFNRIFFRLAINQIGDEGAKAFAAVLQCNTTLTNLRYLLEVCNIHIYIFILFLYTYILRNCVQHEFRKANLPISYIQAARQ